MKKIAVFGANGNIGLEAVKAFRNADWQVRAITRNGIFDHLAEIETAAADAMVENEVIAASQGCDFIFNGINPPYPKWSKMCLPISRNMIAAARQHRSVHLFPGNIYNFGTNIPATITDLSATDCDTTKGKIRVKMESLFRQAAEHHDVQTIIIRAGDFFGNSGSGFTWFDQIISKLPAAGKLTYPGAMDAVHSWAYLPDLANSFVKIANQADRLKNFEEFHFEGHAKTGTQLKNALQQVIGKQLKVGGMPWPLLRLAGIFSPMLREVCEMSYLWNAPHRMDGHRLAEQVGKLQHTGLQDALAECFDSEGFGFFE